MCMSDLWSCSRGRPNRASREHETHAAAGDVRAPEGWLKISVAVDMHVQRRGDGLSNQPAELVRSRTHKGST